MEIYCFFLLGRLRIVHIAVGGFLRALDDDLAFFAIVGRDKLVRLGFSVLEYLDDAHLVVGTGASRGS